MITISIKFLYDPYSIPKKTLCLPLYILLRSPGNDSNPNEATQTENSTETFGQSLLAYQYPLLPH